MLMISDRNYMVQRHVERSAVISNKNVANIHNALAQYWEHLLLTGAYILRIRPRQNKIGKSEKMNKKLQKINWPHLESDAHNFIKNFVYGVAIVCNIVWIWSETHTYILCISWICMCVSLSHVFRLHVHVERST